MREGEEEEAASGSVSDAGGRSSGGGGAKLTLGERRGMAPGTLRVHTGADGAWIDFCG